jgi:hypothetical protein
MFAIENYPSIMIVSDSDAGAGYGAKIFSHIFARIEKMRSPFFALKTTFLPSKRRF